MHDATMRHHIGGETSADPCIGPLPKLELAEKRPHSLDFKAHSCPYRGVRRLMTGKPIHSARGNGTPFRYRDAEQSIRRMTVDAIEAIYEAALIPQRWNEALDHLGKVSGSMSSAILIFSDHYSPRGIASPAVADIFADFLASANWQASVRIQRTLALKPAGFVVVDDLVSPEESESDSVWASMRSVGCGWQACTMVPMPSGETVTFTVERAREAGPYRPEDIAELDRLRPHLARAGLVSARLAMMRAREAIATLEQLGLAAAVLTDKGTICAANALMGTMSLTLFPGAFDRITIADKSANALLQQGLEQLRTTGSAEVQSIPVAATGSHGAKVLHLLPLQGLARDTLAGSHVLIVVSAIAAGGAPSEALLSGLFDLTPAESRLARSLAGGRSISDSAQLLNIQTSTARSYLERIFYKTGVRRQAELVALIHGSSPATPAS